LISSTNSADAGQPGSLNWEGTGEASGINDAEALSYCSSTPLGLSRPSSKGISIDDPGNTSRMLQSLWIPYRRTNCEHYPPNAQQRRFF
jgi:hypothetical protein